MLRPFPANVYAGPFSAAAVQQDELTEAVIDAIQTMSSPQKASLLLESSLALIRAGQYGEKVERYLDVFLRTPGVAPEDVSRAQLARGNARRHAAERLLAQACQDFQAVTRTDPANREALAHLQRDGLMNLLNEASYKRAPLEVWDRIASFIPRHHLRTWLSVSSFHREIAHRRIFRTLDLFFGDDQMDSVNKGLDLFSRVKKDPVFARRVKTLRVHWAYEEGDMLDLMLRLFREALPYFTALTEFEWIGYPELRDDDVKVVLASHPNLHSLGLIGWHFDAEGVSAFHHLRKFTLRAEDDDGWADMGEVRKVLDNNVSSLRHLCLGAYLKREHSWDLAFESASIAHLTHLDLVDTRMSHRVFARIAHAQNLQSLTLHGTFEEPAKASVVFGSDHILDGAHTFLPHLEAFRCVLVGHDDDRELFLSITKCLSARPKLRRLDLGNCPWDLVRRLLPGLPELQVLRVRIPNLGVTEFAYLCKMLPKGMVALHVACVISDRPMEEYATLLAPFRSLTMLHLWTTTTRRRPQISAIAMLSEKEIAAQTDQWVAAARNVAATISSLDFIGWHGEHFVVVRDWSGVGVSVEKDKTHGHNADPKTSTGTSAGLGMDVKSTSKRKEKSADKHPQPHSHLETPTFTHLSAHTVELKDLPPRRRLDCGSGVDLGGADAAWLERKDVPIDYEVPGLEHAES